MYTSFVRVKHRTVSIVSVLPSTGESVLIVLASIFKMILCFFYYILYLMLKDNLVNTLNS